MPSMSRSQMKKQADRDFMLSLLGSLMQGANAYGNYRQGNRQLDLQQQEQDAVQGRFDANMAYQKEQDAFNRAPATLPEMFAGNDWITNQDKSWAFPLLSGKQMDQQRLDQAHSQWAQEFGFNQDQANLDELFRQGQQGRSIELLNLEHQLRMQEMAQQYENQLGLKLMEGMGQPGDVAGLDFTDQKNMKDFRDFLVDLSNPKGSFSLMEGAAGPDALGQLGSIGAFLSSYDMPTLNNPQVASQLDQALTLALNRMAPQLAELSQGYDPNSGNPMTPEQEQYVQNLKYLQSIGQMVGDSIYGQPGSGHVQNYTTKLLSPFEQMAPTDQTGEVPPGPGVESQLIDSFAAPLKYLAPSLLFRGPGGELSGFERDTQRLLDPSGWAVPPDSPAGMVMQYLLNNTQMNGAPSPQMMDEFQKQLGPLGNRKKE